MARSIASLTPITGILISGLTAVGMGCASAGVTSVVRPSDGSMLQRPGVLLVYDFAVAANDVMIDTLGAQFMSEGEKLTEKEQTARATANAFSVALVEQLRNDGINAQRAERGDIPPLHALVLKGQFITIDEGSRAKRMVIGFGAGSSELRARARRLSTCDRAGSETNARVGSGTATRLTLTAAPRLASTSHAGESQLEAV
ncbi:MAG: DUF4410 domain-containing protein [Myxococcales bacterium]|nr:DUF4410 domain-containing protein [Myxococcales bacterium]